MRCPDCNRFVSFDSEVDPEIDVNVSDWRIVGTCRISNNCGECGTELKETTFDVDVEIPEEHECDGELSADASGSRTDRLENKTRTGKLIKHARYMKHLYGAEILFDVSCSKCDFTTSITWSDEIVGSEMDEL